ncbi:MAG TPA: hypothetical protein DCR40_18220 [Prolixibacteraceae bacterium]|nr:hypothetical protein [Prolixibacteraceae bacterium]
MKKHIFKWSNSKIYAMSEKSISFNIHLQIELLPDMSPSRRSELKSGVDQILIPLCEMFGLDLQKCDYDYYKSYEDELQKIYISVIQYKISRKVKSVQNYHCFAGIVVSVFELLTHDDDFRECLSHYKLLS